MLRDQLTYRKQPANILPVLTLGIFNITPYVEELTPHLSLIDDSFQPS